MATNKMKTLFRNLILLSGLALVLTGCPDPICFNPEPTYIFAVTAHFTPEQDSIKVGDTLYLVSEFPTRIIPIGGNEVVDYSNSTGVHSILGVRVLLPNADVAAGAVDAFDYFNLDGQIYNSKEIPSPERVQQLLYAEDGDKYILKVGLIPKKKGIYSLVVGNGLSNGRKTGSKCTRAAFEITVANTDPHMHYLDDFTDTPLDQLPKIHYLFKVY